MLQAVHITFKMEDVQVHVLEIMLILILDKHVLILVPIVYLDQQDIVYQLQVIVQEVIHIM